MFKPSLRFFLFGSTFLFLVGSVDSTFAWIHDSCTYYNSQSYLDKIGSENFPKLQGEWNLCIRQDITVFKGKTVVACSPSPNHGWSTDSSSPAMLDPQGCWSNCIQSTDTNVCDGYDPIYDGSGTIIGSVCTGYHTEWMISGCNQPGGTFTHKVDGSPFRSGHTLFSVCNPTNSLTPNTSLIVWKMDGKSYKWDEVPPVCQRSGYSTSLGLGNTFIDDATLASKISTFNTSVTDYTLTYTGTILTASPRSYRGEWTNQNIRARGVCTDGDSGCDPAYPSPGSTTDAYPLKHLQTSFTHTPFVDVAGNSSSGTCDSTATRLTDIQRLCDYEIRSDYITGAIIAYPAWYSALAPSDKTFLTDTAGRPPLGTDSNFASTISNLRRLSMSGSTSLSVAKGLPPTHDLLYRFVANSCRYTPVFSTNPVDTIVPLIDKIKPTIEISAQIGSGATTSTLLLKQEGTAVAGSPAINNITKSFYAGSGTIEFALFDSGSSTFTAPAVWNNFNGISGFSGYLVTICQTKTHSGEILNSTCSGTPSHVVYSDVFMLSGPYNPTGSIFTPHSITGSIFLSDTSGIQVAGEYQVYIAVLDTAGNTNTATAIFRVNPTPDVDCPECTIITVCSDPLLCEPSVNPPSTTETGVVSIETSTGSVVDPSAGGGIFPVLYANASDKITYRINLYDIYGNPVKNWNLYDFGLADTGVYLDAVSGSGMSALFLSTGSTDFFNTPRTVVTDETHGGARFSVISYTPGQFPQQLKYSYRLWDENMNEVGPVITTRYPPISYSNAEFRHILTGAIDLYTTNRIDLGTNNDVRLDFYPTTTTADLTLEKFYIFDFLETLKSRANDGTIPSPYFSVTKTGSYDGEISFSPNYPSSPALAGAHGSFVAEQIGPIFSDTLNIKSWPYLTVTFGDTTRGGPQTAKYYVSATEDNYGSGIVFGTGELNRIYVQGNKRTTGKEGYVDITSSIGSTNSADARNAVHKNVAILLRNRTDFQTSSDYHPMDGIINRVKYISGSIDISTLDDDMNRWDVVIVKGGNLTIDVDFNTGTSLSSVKHKGFIVLSDDMGNGGNIYIKPNVRFIGSTLFADESVLAVNAGGVPYAVSDSTRTKDLDYQIVFYGGIFSKNTVGGAVRASSSGEYILPWKNTTTSLDEAVKYDLAFLRMSNEGWQSTNLNRGRSEFVIILHDERNISDPLPGFVSTVK